MHRGGDEAAAVYELRIAHLIDRDDRGVAKKPAEADLVAYLGARYRNDAYCGGSVSYTHLRAHET